MGKKEQVEQLTTYMANFVSYIGKVLPDDIKAKINELAEKEDSPLSKVIYQTMQRNQVLAKELNRPSCQDTGVLQFWVKCGTNFPLIGELEALLKEAVVKATFEAPLRHNSVETFDEYNTGKNVGKGTPTVFWDIVPDSDKCEIYTYMAGGGCTLPGKAMVLMPGEGYEGCNKIRYGCHDILWLKCLSATPCRCWCCNIRRNSCTAFQESSYETAWKPQRKRACCIHGKTARRRYQCDRPWTSGYGR